MRIVCNRFNPVWVIKKMEEISSKATFYKRWQVSLQDKRGRYYDHYFVCKPTRKQIRKLLKNVMAYVPFNHTCYECGKRIGFSESITLDDLNYAHANCLFGASK